jgi:hypothetical protein
MTYHNARINSLYARRQIEPTKKLFFDWAHKGYRGDLQYSRVIGLVRRPIDMNYVLDLALSGTSSPFGQRWRYSIQAQEAIITSLLEMLL